MAGQELLDLFYLGKEMEWRYKLDQYEAAAIKELIRVYENAKIDIRRQIQAAPDYVRQEALMQHIEEMLTGLRSASGMAIAEMATLAATQALFEYQDLLSVEGRVSGFNFVSLTKEQIGAWVEEPVGGRLLEEWLQDSFDTRILDNIKSEIGTGLAKGSGFKDIFWRLMEKGINLSRDDAITIARTYVQSVNSKAQEAVYEANDDIVKRVRWCATFENSKKSKGLGTCLSCAALDGQEWAVKDKNRPPMPLHPRCFIGETPIFAPNKLAAFVASYSGPVIELTLADSRRITVTPNHMFLTPYGFASAKSLTNGDDIFDSPAGKWISSTVPNNNRKPTTIEEEIEAFSKSSSMSTIRVPVSTEYLHGDAEFFNGYVDVIASDSFLRGDINAAIEESIDHDLLRFSDMCGHVSLSTFSQLAGQLISLRDASDGGISSRSVSPMFLRRSLSHHQRIGFMDTPNLCSSILQDSSYDLSGYNERVSNGLFGFSGIVPINYGLIGRFRDNVFPIVQLNAISDKYIADGARFFMQYVSDSAQVHSSKVHGNDSLIGNHDCFSGMSSQCDTIFANGPFDNMQSNLFFLTQRYKRLTANIPLAKVVNIRENYFSGHVFDLHTFSTLYYSNGLIASNCRCTMLPVTATYRELGLDIDELEDAARPYTLRELKGIDEGGKRAILEVGQHQGDWGTWLETRSDKFQRDALGPGRYDLWKSGKITLEDMVNSKTGRLLTLKELLR